MAQSKEERNRKRREQYKAGKEKGLKRNQLRSIKKAITEDESIAEKAAGIFSGLVKAITEGLDNLANDTLQNGEIGKPPSRGKISSSKGFPSGKGGGKGKGGGGGGKPPKGPGKSQKDFERYAKRVSKQHPELSANDILKRYRKNTGKSIGNQKAKDIIRDVKHQEKRKEKVTRFKYYGNGKNPDAKKYIKDRYIYKVKYRVERDGFIEPSTEYATIAVSRKLSKREVVDATYQMFDEAQTQGKEKYRMLEIVDGSVEILYAIDTEK